MISVLNSKESKDLDQEIIASKDISKNQLIDNAGKAIAYHLIEKIDNPFNKKILCIAGIGDNGIDAIVCNSYLNENNVNSDLLIINPKKVDSKYLKKYKKDSKYFS